MPLTRAHLDNTIAMLTNATTNGEKKAILDAFIAQHGFIDARSDYGDTLLIIAIYRSNVEVAAMILGKGAEVNATGTNTRGEMRMRVAILLCWPLYMRVLIQI